MLQDLHAANQSELSAPGQMPVTLEVAERQTGADAGVRKVNGGLGEFSTVYFEGRRMAQRLRHESAVAGANIESACAGSWHEVQPLRRQAVSSACHGSTGVTIGPQVAPESIVLFAARFQTAHGWSDLRYCSHPEA